MTVLRLLRAMAAFIVLLALVFGFPVLFYKIAGLPFPDHVPSLEQIVEALSAPDDGTLFVTALELIAWGTWATFSLTVIGEVIAKVRGQHLNVRLPGLRGMQRLAAYLVASATLAVLMPGVSNAVVPPPPVVAMAPMHPLGEPAATDVKAPPKERIYRVKQGDSLWSIADNELGNPRRWPKIWKLNARSRQPDGRTFAAPGLIRPGWKLRLSSGKRPKLPSPVSTTEQPPAADIPPKPSPSETPRPEPSSTHLTKRETAAAIRLSSGSLVALAYAAGISTAYVAGRLHRRRRRIPPAATEPVTITPEPEPPAPVRELHRVHRQAFVERDEPVPSDGELMRHDHSIDIPELVHIGQASDGSPLRIALEGPGIGFTGPGGGDTVRYLAVDLLRQSNNYRVQIIVSITLAEELFGLSQDGLREIVAGIPGLLLAPSHEDALQNFEEAYFLRSRMVLEREADIGALRRRDPGEVLPAILLIAEIDTDVSERVAAPLASARGVGIGGIFLGSWSGGVTCVLDSTHTVTAAEGRGADSLVGAQLFHITAEEAAAHLQQLPSAGEESVSEAESPPENEQADWPGAALVRLTILGHPTIHVRGKREPVLLSWLQLSTLIYLALHPNGVTRDQLATALWPDDLGKDIHNVLRHLRGALVAAAGYKGAEAKRAPFISASTTKDSAIYRIDHELISIDLWDYESALEQVRTAADLAERRTALLTAAGLCTGELADGFSAEWIEDQRYPLTRSQADVLAQLAELLAGEDAEQALSALERARRLDPDTEETYFRIIRLQLRLDRRDDASRTAELLRQHQCGLGLSSDSQMERAIVKTCGSSSFKQLSTCHRSSVIPRAVRRACP
ncbi:hypothetical protein GCM10022419_132330 [Nonomuraea rosea]|uniref:LysM domain-containing protein n=1 Tax=Nonomuraea rosea TaxID=638574 RepID=A0ABP7A3J8_9ACTN